MCEIVLLFDLIRFIKTVNNYTQLSTWKTKTNLLIANKSLALIMLIIK